jgi:hypothetical protein
MDSARQDDLAWRIDTRLHALRQAMDISRFQVPLSSHASQALADDVVGLGWTQPTVRQNAEGRLFKGFSVSRHPSLTFIVSLSLPYFASDVNISKLTLN